MFDKCRIPPYSNRRLPPDVVEGASILAQDSKGVVVLDITMPTRTAQASRPSLILGVLALGGAAYALLQSLVVPALPVLQHDLHTSTSGVAWVFTAYLLAASVITPIAGRLGDMYGKKRVLVIALGGLAVGSALGGLASTLPVMITART